MRARHAACVLQARTVHSASQVAQLRPLLLAAYKDAPDGEPLDLKAVNRCVDDWHRRRKARKLKEGAEGWHG